MVPGEVLWPTLAFATLIATVFGGIAVLRMVPSNRNRGLDDRDRAALDDLAERTAQLEQLQQRVGELEERVDFAERLLARQREQGQLPPPAT